MTGDDKDYGSMSLHELFRSEAEGQVQQLTDGLLALEHAAPDPATVEALMRAAHSLKGAARIVNLRPVEQLAHALEDCFVAAQTGRLALGKTRIDSMLAAVDMILRIAAMDESQAPAWMERRNSELDDLLASLRDAADPGSPPSMQSAANAAGASAAPPAAPVPAVTEDMRSADHVLKVSSRRFDRLLSLAGEARIGAHAWQPFTRALQRHKQRQSEMIRAFDQFRQALLDGSADELLRERLALLQQRIEPLREDLTQRIAECETLERRQLGTSERMLEEVLALRMRPFRDGVRALPRMVRDLAHSLGKQAVLEIVGDATMVDRDVLARIESPLNQMLRNALDHGVETPAGRRAAGKPEQATLRVEARHRGGVLVVRVDDDGAGVDLAGVRERIARRGMASAAMAAAMSEAELLEFLLLPGFSLRESADTVSGRGVGLDLVQAEVRAMNGSVQLLNHPGRGFSAVLTLPLSQSIVRALVIDIAGEACALPINKVERVLRLPRASIHSFEDRQFFAPDGGGSHVSLIPGAPLLGLGEAQFNADALAVVVIGDGERRHGLVVDGIVGERNLAVQRIDRIFGKLRDVSAAALLEDGAPVLILDVSDLLVSIEKMADEGALHGLRAPPESAAARRKRVLVVDDSLTVREMERSLLQARGYDVDTAVDGMDAWNAVRAGSFELVITDVDMPRMDGIELTMLIKADTRLRHLPVMIVSYKDRPEDRRRGIEAGADYYLAKGSFHDETLLDAVFDLIGGNGE